MAEFSGARTVVFCVLSFRRLAMGWKSRVKEAKTLILGVLTRRSETMRLEVSPVTGGGMITVCGEGTSVLLSSSSSINSRYSILNGGGCWCWPVDM